MYVASLKIKTIGRAFTVPLTAAGTSTSLAVTFAWAPFFTLVMRAVRVLSGVGAGAAAELDDGLEPAGVELTVLLDVGVLVGCETEGAAEFVDAVLG